MTNPNIPTPAPGGGMPKWVIILIVVLLVKRQLTISRLVLATACHFARSR